MRAYVLGKAGSELGASSLFERLLVRERCNVCRGRPFADVHPPCEPCARAPSEGTGVRLEGTPAGGRVEERCDLGAGSAQAVRMASLSGASKRGLDAATGPSPPAEVPGDRPSKRASIISAEPRPDTKRGFVPSAQAETRDFISSRWPNGFPPDLGQAAFFSALDSRFPHLSTQGLVSHAFFGGRA